MTEENIFPAYIPRQEECEILDVVDLLRQDRLSRAVLLYGPGGVGKTRLVRALAERHSADGMIAWLDPIDVDDTEYWLLSNLEATVARQLDPENQYFGPYRAYLSQLPSYTRTHASPETVVSHLGRIKRVFAECYKNFIAGSGKMVVLTFDTVEVIRGMYLLPTLAQWMKMLPDTLFVLSGRPPSHDSGDEDPIQRELGDPYQRVPVTTVRLGEFTQQAASEYLEKSHVTAGLLTEEKMKLVLLTRGHPLWLALTVSYLDTKGIPEEVETSLEVIERNMPYGRTMTEKGQQLREAFRHRLVAPYRGTDFWSEAVKRLAAVRQGVNAPIWQQLMVDRPFPAEVSSWGEAWARLLEIPWIRQRANRHFVTLHDAMAEQLAQRVIPVHDQDGGWRRGLWQRVIQIYSAQAEVKEAELAEQRAALDRRFRLFDAKSLLRNQREDETGLEGAFVQEAAQLDARKRELDQLKTVRLLYQGLIDFSVGCVEFLRLLEAAKRDHDVLFQELLAIAVERFLPGSVEPRIFDDVISGVINEFRQWLTSEQPGVYIEVSLSLADYMIRTEQPDRTVRLLEHLPMADASVDQLYRLNNMLGNAYLRLPGQVREALPRLRRALALAEGIELESADRHRRIAEAHKELGFYCRNVGLWQEADKAYERARDAILVALTTRGSDDDRAEMSSIYNNWAYVKGLGGSYRDGINLIESAITVRRRLQRRLEEGISQSVRGEVFRYQQRFQRAWEAYSAAEFIFDEQRSNAWRGMIYQEQ
ncbi:MAG: ATP-binding protein, partial [Acidobacteriaceae bacterium]|nr:ATP-binding protein [Acidobacteriaceae bacterium]